MAKNTNRYHIGKNGLPAVCQAKKQLCPLGGDEAHFSSKEEAQIEADKRNEKENPLFGKPHKKERKWGDKKLPDPEKSKPKSKPSPQKPNKKNNRNKSKKDNKTQLSYGDRIRSIEVYTGEIKSQKVGFHYEVSRADRISYYNEKIGEGKPVTRFIIDDGRARPQLQEIYDNGKIRVYDVETHKPITVFCPRPNRVKEIYMKANIPMPEGLYETLKENLVKIDRSATS